MCIICTKYVQYSSEEMLLSHLRELPEDPQTLHHLHYKRRTTLVSAWIRRRETTSGSGVLFSMHGLYALNYRGLATEICFQTLQNIYLGIQTGQNSCE